MLCSPPFLGLLLVKWQLDVKIERRFFSRVALTVNYARTSTGTVRSGWRLLCKGISIDSQEINTESAACKGT